MNEYELATLALREGTLWVAVAQVAATLMVGFGQIGIVWYGIRAMQRASDERAKDRRQYAEDQRQHAKDQRQHAKDQDRRHAETMAALAMQRQALETLIERTATPAG